MILLRDRTSRLNVLVGRLVGGADWEGEPGEKLAPHGAAESVRVDLDMGSCVGADKKASSVHEQLSVSEDF